MSNDCIFCKIVAGEIPAKKIYEDDKVLAFPDMNPQAPVHILVIPKKHVVSAASVDRETIADVILAAQEIARLENLESSGYRLIANHGDDGGQTVYHLHVHLMGGRRMTWPPG
jgi:histidine triad (HIT) family protein